VWPGALASYCWNLSLFRAWARRHRRTVPRTLCCGAAGVPRVALQTTCAGPFASWKRPGRRSREGDREPEWGHTSTRMGSGLTGRVGAERLRGPRIAKLPGGKTRSERRVQRPPRKNDGGTAWEGRENAVCSGRDREFRRGIHDVRRGSVVPRVELTNDTRLFQFRCSTTERPGGGKRRQHRAGWALAKPDAVRDSWQRPRHRGAGRAGGPAVAFGEQKGARRLVRRMVVRFVLGGGCLRAPLSPVVASAAARELRRSADGRHPKPQTPPPPPRGRPTGDRCVAAFGKTKLPCSPESPLLQLRSSTRVLCVAAATRAIPSAPLVPAERPSVAVHRRPDAPARGRNLLGRAAFRRGGAAWWKVQESLLVRPGGPSTGGSGDDSHLSGSRCSAKG